MSEADVTWQPLPGDRVVSNLYGNNGRIRTITTVDDLVSVTIEFPRTHCTVVASRLRFAGHSSSDFGSCSFWQLDYPLDPCLGGTLGGGPSTTRNDVAQPPRTPRDG